MNNLMKFENQNVEVFEYQGKVLFNPRHVGECLELNEKAIQRQLDRMTDKQIIKLTNSDTTNCRIRNLNNKGERFITESGVYKMIFASRSEGALKFQDWVTDEVLPQIRKTGAYMTELKGQEKMFQLLRNEVNGIINEIVSLKVKEIEEKCSDYYRPTHFDKTNISSYIKKRLGITKANDEYELVKQRVLFKIRSK